MTKTIMIILILLNDEYDCKGYNIGHKGSACDVVQTSMKYIVRLPPPKHNDIQSSRMQDLYPFRRFYVLLPELRDSCLACCSNDTHYREREEEVKGEVH